MKTVLLVLGVLCTFNGIVWCLQGINVLPGSFMTGQIQWAYYGALSFIAGLLLLWRWRHLRRAKP